MQTVFKKFVNFMISILKKLKGFFAIIFHNKKATTGFFIILFFAILALFGRQIFPYDDATSYSNMYLPPSQEHWLGTDGLGRDLFRMIVYGTKDVLEIALMSGLFVVGIGTIVGIISGYFGGIVDSLIGLLINVMMSIPTFPILIMLSMFVTIQGNFTMAVLLSIFSWPGMARTVRSQIVSLKERDFIQICKVMGLSKTHIILRELLPNIFSFVIVNFINSMKNAITASVGLMTLGLALYDPTNWGGIIVTARNNGALSIPSARLTIIAPIMAIMLFQMGSLLFSNGVDEISNPRLRKG